jgi:Tfp pilus assembly protein PilN
MANLQCGLGISFKGGNRGLRINLLPKAHPTKPPSKSGKTKVTPSKPDLAKPDLTKSDSTQLEYAKLDDVKLDPSELERVIPGYSQFSQKKPSQIKSSNILIYICWAIFLLGSLVFLLGEYFDYDLSKGELLSLTEQVAEYQRCLSNEKDLKIQNQGIQTRESELALINHLYQPWLAILNGLASALPEDAWLIEIKGTSQGNLMVNGRSLTFIAVGEYIKNLQGITLFKQVKLQEIQRVSPKIPDYIFTIDIEAGGTTLDDAQK